MQQAKQRPFVMIDPADQEELLKQLRGGAGSSALSIWVRLQLAAFRTGTNSPAVSGNSLAYDCALSRKRVVQLLAELERLGFVAIRREKLHGAGTCGNEVNKYTILRGPYSKNGATAAIADKPPEAESPMPAKAELYTATQLRQAWGAGKHSVKATQPDIEPAEEDALLVKIAKRIAKWMRAIKQEAK